MFCKIIKCQCLFSFFRDEDKSNPREKHEKHEHRKILSSIAERARKIHIFGKLLQIPDLLCASPRFLHACLHDPEAPRLGVLDYSLSCDPQNCIRFHRPNSGTPSFETTLHRWRFGAALKWVLHWRTVVWTYLKWECFCHEICVCNNFPEFCKNSAKFPENYQNFGEFPGILQIFFCRGEPGAGPPAFAARASFAEMETNQFCQNFGQFSGKLLKF